MSEKALQITKERREAKSKGERESYIQLNVELQRTARRDKAFLNKQCKETEESSTMGKTRDLFKKIGDIKETFHARMDIIKYRNGKDLTEAEETKKRCKNTQKNYTKKILMTQIAIMLWSLT